MNAVVEMAWNFAGMLFLIAIGVGILLAVVLVLDALGRIRWK